MTLAVLGQDQVANLPNVVAFGVIDRFTHQLIGRQVVCLGHYVAVARGAFHSGIDHRTVVHAGVGLGGIRGRSIGPQ